MKIVVIQGPNLNLLGHREQTIYGQMTLKDIHGQMQKVAEQAKVEIEFFQSNLEGEIVDKIQECIGEVNGIIINAAAYSHTSIAIRDTLEVAIKHLPIVEVHISNIARREEFRQKSVIAPVTSGQIMGFGPFGYHMAMVAMLQMLEENKKMQEVINQSKELEQKVSSAEQSAKPNKRNKRK